MIQATNIRAVLFAKDLDGVARFYSEVLGMKRSNQDKDHAVLQAAGFELVVHQIPGHIASGIEISCPPRRREGVAIRMDYPVESIETSRRLAKSFGGHIDIDPPPWTDQGAHFYLGHDPEGNIFGVSEPPPMSPQSYS